MIDEVLNSCENLKSLKSLLENVNIRKEDFLKFQMLVACQGLPCLL